MLKFTLKFVAFFSVILAQIHAASSFELAKNLTSSENEAKVKLLFEGKNYVDENGLVRWDEIVRVLKANALFNTTLPSSREINLYFRSKSDGIIFIKILNEALNQAGFVYFTPVKFDLRKDEKLYKISVQTRYLLDPASFYNILRQNLVLIKNIKRLNDYDYEYELDFTHARLKANTQVGINNAVRLGRPLRDYIINLHGAKSLNARASNLDSWFPKVFFLDKNLNLLKAVMSQKKQNRYSTIVPNGAVYVIISDNYNLDNIRRGLEIQLNK